MSDVSARAGISAFAATYGEARGGFAVVVRLVDNIRVASRSNWISRRIWTATDPGYDPPPRRRVSKLGSQRKSGSNANLKWVGRREIF